MIEQSLILKNIRELCSIPYICLDYNTYILASAKNVKEDTLKDDETKKDSSIGFHSIVLVLTGLFVKLGAIGFILVFGGTIFLCYSDKTQKTEFINNFILLHVFRGNNSYLYFMVVCLITITIFTIIYYSLRLKLKEDEIKLKDGLIENLNKRVSELESKFDKILIKNSKK